MKRASVWVVAGVAAVYLLVLTILTTTESDPSSPRPARRNSAAPGYAAEHEASTS